MSGPERAGLARRIVANSEHEIELRRSFSRKFVPALRPETGNRIAELTEQFKRGWMDLPLGKLPADKAWKLPAPSLLRIASARIERAELPVQRKRAL